MINSGKSQFFIDAVKDAGFIETYNFDLKNTTSLVDDADHLVLVNVFDKHVSSLKTDAGMLKHMADFANLYDVMLDVWCFDDNNEFTMMLFSDNKNQDGLDGVDVLEKARIRWYAEF